MSVIAVRIADDVISIASDSISIRYATQDKGNRAKFVKLAKPSQDDLVIGGVGYTEELSLLLLYAERHSPLAATEMAILHYLSEFSDWKNAKINKIYGEENEYFIIFQGKVFHANGWAVVEVTTYESIGAGMDFALTSLWHNKQPAVAVDAACHFSPYCERPVISWEYDRATKVWTNLILP